MFLFPPHPCCSLAASLASLVIFSVLYSLSARISGLVPFSSFPISIFSHLFLVVCLDPSAILHLFILHFLSAISYLLSRCILYLVSFHLASFVRPAVFRLYSPALHYFISYLEFPHLAHFIIYLESLITCFPCSIIHLSPLISYIGCLIFLSFCIVSLSPIFYLCYLLPFNFPIL